jgi:hypothetical protein
MILQPESGIFFERWVRQVERRKNQPLPKSRTDMESLAYMSEHPLEGHFAIEHKD